ncbi:Sulfatase [Planctomycetales bacterium 10988]|nr:Sulfatase [Planctomycetales bacterium 10988]
MKRSGCSGFQQLAASRRDFLQVGAIGGLGLTLGNFFQMRQAQADIKDYKSVEGTAKSVISIYLPGGMAHQETFDPKPIAPIEYRGPLKAIKTNVEGVYFGEYLQKTAQIADKLTVIRSMTHGEAAHERGTHNMFTGYRPSPALKYPSMGSIVAHEFGPRKDLPPYVCIPNQPNEFAGTGYLSSSYGPFSLGSDPASKGFTVRDLSLPGGINEDRFARRRSILDTVNSHFRSREEADALDAMDSFYQRAYSMISSKDAREAFDIDKEDKKTREQYGMNQAGQRLLMARRLVESGVRFVNLTYGGWDMHQRIESGMKRWVPDLDRAFAALIQDLSQRGMLDETLVVISSEFGRTPKINPQAGRDHWPKVFSVVMAGGGIKGGMVYGSSDPTAAEPEENAVTVEDWASTVYDRLGIVADKELMAPGDRPIEIIDGGKPIKDIMV